MEASMSNLLVHLPELICCCIEQATEGQQHKVLCQTFLVLDKRCVLHKQMTTRVQQLQIKHGVTGWTFHDSLW